MQNVIISWKNIGETPLECLERERISHGISLAVPMTYAGRLDPMAEGVLILLVGDECKEKQKYLGLDKEYEIEVLFGIKTDTGDCLGLIEGISEQKSAQISLKKYVGKFTQEYPMYSSKTVKGRQLHEYARSGEEPEEMPTKEVEIYSIDKISEKEVLGKEIAKEVIEKVGKVKGDFRQEEIIKRWQKFEKKYTDKLFQIIKLKVSCSSGVYMRSLAEKMGEDAGVGAVAVGIRRTVVSGL